MKKTLLLLTAIALLLASCASTQTKLLDVYELDYTTEDIIINELLRSDDPENHAVAREYLKYRVEEKGLEATEENILQAAREVMDKFTQESAESQSAEEPEKPALAPLSAKDSYTVEEFSAMEVDSARSVKIVDSLDEGAQRKLVSACFKLKDKVALDLSDCDFGGDEARINFFHIRNVRSCVLPLRTKAVVNFDCDDLEEVVLPDGLEEIAAQAFFESGLRRADIPSSVKRVGACAFGDCDFLKVITTNGNPNVENWSAAWSAWNAAQIVQSGGYEAWWEYDGRGNSVHFKDSDGKESWYEYTYWKNGAVRTMTMYTAQ